MKAYKGFDEDMTCRGFQYEEGKEYEEKAAVLCITGFHACLNPLDTFKYYDPINSVYHEVELDGHIESHSTTDIKVDSKLCATKIKIGPAIELSDYIAKAVEYMSYNLTKVDYSKPTGFITTFQADKSKCDNVSTLADVVCGSGFRSLATTFYQDEIAVNTGFCSAANTHSRDCIAVTNGSCSVSVAHGDFSTAISNGNKSVTENYGDYGLSVQMGSFSIADSIGKRSVSINGGGFGKAQASGEDSSAIVAGKYSEAVVKEKGAIACALGNDCRAKGCIGSWLLLTEWECTCEGSERKDTKLFYVDGEKVKADTFYKLHDGELVKA